MRKLNAITAALLLSIGTSCVSAAAVSEEHHRGDPKLARRFCEVALPLNEKIALKHPAIKKFTSVSGVQRPASAFTPPLFQAPNVSVVNADTLAAVFGLIDQGFKNPVALIAANKTTQGGGVRNGCRAQEEDMYRATTVAKSTVAAKEQGHYPLKEFSAIYSPTVYAHSNVDEMHSFAFISMAGYRATSGRVDPADMPKNEADFIEGMKEKIRVILSTAIVNGHTSIVLGALGCGAFAKDAEGNLIPWIPEAVAAAFNTVLNETYMGGVPYLNRFANVMFAIKEGTPNLIPIFERALGVTAGDSIKDYGNDRRAAMNAALTQHLGAVPNLLPQQGTFYADFTEQTTGTTSAVIEKMSPPQNLMDSWGFYLTWDNGREKTHYFVQVRADSLAPEANAWLSAHAAHLESIKDANSRSNLSAAPARALPAPTYNAAPAQPAGYGLAAQNATPAAAHTVPALDPNTLKATVKNALKSATRESVSFNGDSYTPSVVNTATAWRGANAPWKARISSFTVNQDKGFTMHVHIAHQDAAGNWYTTEVKITGSQKALTDDAKKWLQKNVK